MTSRLGDVRALEMVRAHDAIVRRALGEVRGREIKHTGDGLMASFAAPTAAANCARAVQKAIAAFNRDNREALFIRIGIHAGEPVEDSNDLFGRTVQMAARLCAEAAPATILLSEEVRDGLHERSGVSELGSREHKGFADPVRLYELAWC